MNEIEKKARGDSYCVLTVWLRDTRFLVEFSLTDSKSKPLYMKPRMRVECLNEDIQDFLFCNRNEFAFSLLMLIISQTHTFISKN